MSAPAQSATVVAAPPAPVATRYRWRIPLVAGVLATLLFFAYLHMARVYPANSDGAGNALQAWDMLHGNLLLHGWTLSDVSFYTTEVPLDALVELVLGLRADVVHVAAALTYTLLVLVVAALARGRARGWEAAARVGIAAAIMLAPAPASGYLTLLTSPDHTGTGVPLLLTWLYLDRYGGGRALRVAGGAALLLAWGEVADPLVTFAGAVPLVAASAWRVLYGAEPGVPWRRRLAGTDAALLATAPVSVLLSWAFLRIVTALGGFHVNPAATQFSPVALWHDRAQLLGRLIAMAYGGYLPEKSGVLPTALGLVHLAALPVVLAAICVVCYRAARRRADRVSLILAVAVVTVTAAYWVSAVDMNLGSAREVIAILPLGAALCGRVWGLRLRRPRHAAPLVVALLAACVAVAVQAGSPAGPVGYIENRGQAEWLVAHGYRFGLATYWCGNSISLASGGRVTAAAVLLDGGVHPYHWESRRDWYLPSRHDARFLAVDLRTADPVEVAALRRQFGPPAASHLVGRYGLLLLYDHNILTQLVPG